MRKDPQKLWKKFLTLGIIVLVIAAIFLGYQWSRYNHYITTPVDETDDTKVSFLIHKGDSVSHIATILEEKKLILDKDAFKNYVRWGGYDRGIVAGRFLLKRSLTIPEIVTIISDNKQSEYILTVPEGATLIDIDKKLVELGVIQPNDFIKATKDFDQYEKYPFLEKEKISGLVHPLEGYLFPDTYFIDPTNFHSENLIQLMLNNFQKRLDEELNKDHNRSLFEIITMASIVEKEVRTAKDLPVVAGILWKRLDNDWQLGADATLLYLKSDRTIDYQDLKEDSPYNTRKNFGLPPGPISNPGIKSIMATLYPEESPYFFYLTKAGSGEVVYAVTNDEHNVNKEKHL